MSTLNIRSLEYLDAAIRYGSLNQAAKALGVSQPALSKAIGSLEAQLGATLIRRSNQGVTPTTVGRAAARHGRSLRELNERFLSESIPPARRRPARSVRVGCGPSEATRLLPMAITSLADSAPATEITVLYGLNEDLMPMVKRGDIDFALSSVPRNATDPDLVHQVLQLDRAAVVASADHPLADGRDVEPAMLIAYPWVLARRRELERRALDELFLSAGLKAPEVAVETTSATLMKSLLLQGEHLSFLPREMIYWEQQAGQLVCLTVEPEGWERQVGITQLRETKRRRSVNLLIAEIVAAAQELEAEEIPG